MKPLASLSAILCLIQLLTCCAEPTSDRTADFNGTSLRESLIRDCSDLPYGSATGVYLIQPDLQTPTPAYCDMDDGEGWTVFQRRADVQPRQNFTLDWEAYKWGLGNFGGEFWWGLNHLWQLTSQLDRVYELRVDLWDWDNQTRYATYQRFTIASEADWYRIDFVDYYGTAGDSLSDHNGMKFSTWDKDNDMYSGNCASSYKGGWWYNACLRSNLNGLYLPGKIDVTDVYWYDFRGYDSLKATTMKIRPTMKLNA